MAISTAHLKWESYVAPTLSDFGDNVSYVCESGHFFHENKELKRVNLTCLTDQSGTWSQLDPSKHFCVNPQGTLISMLGK
jgi:hypothetical protein